MGQQAPNTTPGSDVQLPGSSEQRIMYVIRWRGYQHFLISNARTVCVCVHSNRASRCTSRLCGLHQQRVYVMRVSLIKYNVSASELTQKLPAEKR